MIVDASYKFLRKSLGKGLYRSISRSVLGRARNYETIDTYRNIFRHYTQNGLVFGNKSVLEVGPGNQFLTALYFLSAGAKSVILVDPKISHRQLREDLDLFNKAENKHLAEAWVRDRMSCHASLEAIPSATDLSLDIMCSHYVLEHFNDLPGFFRQAARLLKPAGVCYNRVDVTDHTYHVFAKTGLTHWILKRRMLYHLRYSNRLFAKLNDPKCYMNRALLPEYLRLARSHGFTMSGLSTTKDNRVPIHEDLLRDLEIKERDHLYVSSFSLALRKAGHPEPVRNA
jgi:SAM-dependent methyltransferase